MTAIGRLGGEWKIDYTPTAGRAIHGLQTNASKSARVEPGRTGGAMFRHVGGTTSTPTGLKSLPAYTTLYADTATRETHRPIGDADEYEIPEDHFLIARAYVRVNSYPDAPGITNPGVAILQMGGQARFGAQNGASLGIMLGNDGRFMAVSADVGNALADIYPADNDFILPLNEWAMLETAASWSSTQPRKQFLRVTLLGEESRVIFRRCNLTPLPVGFDFNTLHAELSVGVFQNQFNAVGAGFQIDVDDMGLNTSEGEEHSTWLGPGAVRVARPIADGDVGDAFDTGFWTNNARGQQGRTIGDHPVGTFTGDDLEIGIGGPFYDALNNNPVLNPASAPAEVPNRGRAHDRLVTSVGTDWHEHGAGASWSWRYDTPRIAFGGEALNVVCDASVRDGVIAFARAVAFAGFNATLGGPTFSVLPRADYYFSMFTDNEEPPELGGPPDGGFPEDLATTNFGRWLLNAPTIDSAWRGALGRLQQFPELAETPTLTFRREHFFQPPDGGTSITYEWYLIGAGIIYEYGFEPQDALPTCEPGVLVIGPMTNHIRRVRGGRIGSDG